MKNEVQPPRKPLLFYYAIMMAVLVLVNVLLVPTITGMQVREVTYTEFLSMLDQGVVREASVGDLELTFIAEIDGENAMFTTGLIEDNNRVSERLSAAGVLYGKYVPEEPSLLM